MARPDELCRSFLDLWFHFDPAAATRAGVPGHDDRLGSFDAESVRLYIAALKSIAGAVEELDIEETDDEIDRTALLDHLRVVLFRFEQEKPWRRDPSLWTTHACEALDALLIKAPRDAGAASALLARIGALPGFFTAAVDTIRRPPRILSDSALAQLDGLGQLLDDAAVLLAQVASPDAATPVSQAQRAAEQLGDALRSGIAADLAPGASAIGEEEVDRRLHHEHASAHNGAEVWRGALRVATEAEHEVMALAAALDPSRPWREVYQEIRDPSDDAAGYQAELAGALRDARTFAEAHGLSRDEPGGLVVIGTPAHELVLRPEPFYRVAGFDNPAAVLAATGDRAAAPWLAARLGIPGIHLHKDQAGRLDRLVRSRLSASSTPLGWALYAVDVMRSEGYHPEPESRLAERVEFLRDAHLAVVDIGLHIRQLTPDQAVDHLLTHLPTDSVTAQALVRRVACCPLEACAAILGFRELERLRDDVREQRGSSFTLEEFHTDLYRYGGMPVPLIRWGLGLDA